MCGIAGLIRTARASELTEQAALGAVSRMVDELRHRGPDGSGVQTVSGLGDDAGDRFPEVVLGHTRLAILDLSAAGLQPMTSADADLHIPFNGEIYNFEQLRHELGPDGWRSHTDTEVILRAYARWGTACVNHLRGMFAFALWDGSRQELFLARDRLGIKPLYYYAPAGRGQLVFA